MQHIDRISGNGIQGLSDTPNSAADHRSNARTLADMAEKCFAGKELGIESGQTRGRF